jgi:hypothetical protein
MSKRFPAPPGAAAVQPSVRVRRPYERPALVEYGSIARLTRSGGSSVMEGPTPAGARQMVMCL